MMVSLGSLVLRCLIFIASWTRRSFVIGSLPLRTTLTDTLCQMMAIQFFKNKMKGHAWIWWHGLEEQLEQIRCVGCTWDNMKQMLQENYFLPDYEISSSDQFAALCQGASLFEEYIESFNDRTVGCYIHEDEKQVHSLFKVGLHAEIH